MQGTRTQAFLTIDGNKIGVGNKLWANGGSRFWQTRLYYSDFAAAGTTKNLDIAVRPGTLIVKSVFFYVLANFTGGVVNAATLSAGTTSSATAFTAAVSVFSGSPKLIASASFAPQFLQSDPGSA